MTNKLKVTAIFDNGGGLTLKLGTEYAHYYTDMAQAAADYKKYQKKGNTEGWEGHEVESMELEYEDIKNGGYYKMDEEDIEKAIMDDEYYFWINSTDFIDEARKLRDA